MTEPSQPDRYTTEEIQTRNYALHLGLSVRRRKGDVLALVERKTKAAVGTYHSWLEVKRAIEQYGARLIA